MLSGNSCECLLYSYIGNELNFNVNGTILIVVAQSNNFCDVIISNLLLIFAM